MAVIFGVLLSLCSLCIGFVGMNLQRIAQRKDAPRPALNVCGVLLGVLAGPTDMASFSFAPQTLLAPVGTLSLVLNLVAAPRLHGDPVTRRDAAATGVIVFGTVICLAFGAAAEDEDAAVPDGGDAALVEGGGGAEGGGGDPSPSTFLVYAVSVALLGALLTSVVIKHRATGGRADAAATAALAGLLGSTTVVAGKHLGQALALGGPLSVAAALVQLLSLCATHLFVINRGVGRHSSVVFIPLNVAASLLAKVVAGFVLYGERPASWLCFLFGAGALLGGVLSLAMPFEEAPAEQLSKASSAALLHPPSPLAGPPSMARSLSSLEKAPSPSLPQRFPQSESPYASEGGVAGACDSCGGGSEGDAAGGDADAFCEEMQIMGGLLPSESAQGDASASAGASSGGGTWVQRLMPRRKHSFMLDKPKVI